MSRKLLAFCVAALTFFCTTAFGVAEGELWRGLYAESRESGANEYLCTFYLLEVRTGEGEAFASLPNFHVWSGAADETWDAVLVAGFDLKADERFVCYRLAGLGSTPLAEEPEVILEFNGPPQPHGDVMFDAGEGAFYVGAEAVATRDDGEKYRETVLYRYEPATGAPAELARLGRHVFLAGEADDDRIYVVYDGKTSYGRRRLYGYVDKKTFDVVPLGIFPDHFGREPKQYVPYGGPEGAGQHLPGAPAALAGPRAYASDTAKAETADERAIYLRDAASPGGYREVKVDGTPGRILYSPSCDAFVYLIYPSKDEDPVSIAITYPDGTSAEPVPVSIREEETVEAYPTYDYVLLYVE
ncbi:MAG: hypothetical protein JSU81_03265 [Candidatus Coatesbacteria bacterium]|nr:MAG: hypothetical protein JSU81_03265 [Candidatus Coatesbacteria bacterium]